VRWTPDITDPEFKKNLKIFHRLVEEAIRICSGDGRNALQARLEELTGLVYLPTDVPLTLNLLLVRRFELERLLLQVGDEEYLRGRAAKLLQRGQGHHSELGAPRPRGPLPTRATTDPNRETGT
jgi:hypothetical protein